MASLSSFEACPGQEELPQLIGTPDGSVPQEAVHTPGLLSDMNPGCPWSYWPTQVSLCHAPWRQRLLLVTQSCPSHVVAGHSRCLIDRWRDAEKN